MKKVKQEKESLII
jgi:hypothetical protein